MNEIPRKILLVYPEFPDTFWSFKHALKFVHKKAGAPKIRVHLELQYILALGRSIYQLGIRGVERLQYWRLFFWTLFRRPRLFSLAITLAILGFHFRQVIELHVS